VSEALSDLLARASEAFDRHEEEECLRRLLNAWRQCRAPRLAALVERLSERLTAGLAPLDCEPGSPTLLKCRPLDLPRLLATVLEGADRGYPGALGPSLRAFQRWPADPRFTPVLLAISRMPVAQDVRIPDELCRLLEEVRDPRTVAPLEALRAGLGTGSMLGGRLSLCLQQLSRYAPPPLDEQDSALCEALEEALAAREASDAARAATREELLARVYADPEDLTARMVLADHLLEGGDPLGELITLQCMPRADEARIEALLSEHRLRWEAPLGVYVERECTRFERGFPVSVRMRRNWSEPLPEPAPCWSTVREIDWAGAVFADVGRWLSHPHLRGVTTLRRMAPELAEELGTRGHPVKQLGVIGPVSKRSPELFNRLGRLPELTRLLVQEASPEDVHLCAASRLASRLERFEARLTGTWSLVATPAKEVPLKATLMREAGTEQLARAIRGAAGFGTRALRIRLEDREAPEGRGLLESAAFAYEKVEWF
jgi:uncharacterized protein (TIGR02996 family)